MHAQFLWYNVSMGEDNQVKIIVALIALFGTCLGILVGYIGRNKHQAVLDAKREQRQSDLFDRLFKEMDDIKKRLDEHNHYAEKISGVEQSITIIQKDIEYLRKEKK